MRNKAFYMATGFFIFGLLWVGLSDIFINSPSLTTDEVLWINLLKGGGFVLFTSLLLFYISKKYNKQLTQVKAQYKRIIEDNPNAMWIFDEETLQILTVNDRAIAVYGYSREEFLSMSIVALRPEKEVEKLMQVIAVIGREETYKGRTLHKKKNGEVFYVDIFSHPTVFEDKKTRIVTVIDIDEKHKADQQILQLTERLKQKTTYLDSLIDSQSNFLVRVDAQGNYTFVNKAFYNKFGYREEELLGQPSLTTVVDQDHEKVLNAVEECVTNPGRVVALKISKPTKKGEILMTSWEFVGITNAKGEVVELQGMGQDVTQEYAYYQELAETKDKLENILSSIHDIVWSARADDFSLLYINAACQAITGYTQQEFYQDNQLWMKITHPEDKERIIEEFPHFFSKGEGDYELRLIHKDGSIRYLNRKLVLTKDEYGNPFVITGISSDITAKKKAEASERESVRIKEEILESMTDGFYAVDQDWNFTYINKEAERMLNVNREDVLGKNGWDYFPDAKELIIYTEYHRAVREQTSVRFDVFFSPLETWFRISAYPTKDGLAAYFQDITKEKELELEIEKSERNLSALINNTQDLIWSVDTDLRLLSFNHSFQQSIKSLTAKSIRRGDSILMSTVFEKEVLAKWEACYKVALAGKRTKISDQFLISGEVFYAETSFNPIFSQGEILGVSCFARDITESKKHENKLKQHNHLLGEIAHVQSHTLRRPVATMLGLVALLDKTHLSDMNIFLVDKMEMVCQELDAVIHKVVKKTYELEE